MDILKAAASVTSGIYDLVEWTVKRLEAPGRDISRQSALGAIAEVSLAIEPGKTGEVAVVVDKTLQHYPARAKQADVEFKKGDKVSIADIGSNVMYVDTFDPSSQQAAPPLPKTVEVGVDDVHDSCCDH